MQLSDLRPGVIAKSDLAALVDEETPVTSRDHASGAGNLGRGVEPVRRATCIHPDRAAGHLLADTNPERSGHGELVRRDLKRQPPGPAARAAAHRLALL